MNRRALLIGAATALGAVGVPTVIKAVPVVRSYVVAPPRFRLVCSGDILAFLADAMTQLRDQGALETEGSRELASREIAATLSTSLPVSSAVKEVSLRERYLLVTVANAYTRSTHVLSLVNPPVEESPGPHEWFAPAGLACLEV